MKSFIGIILVLILSMWSIFSLMQKGFYPMHDDVQVVRVYEMHKALSDGMFPVRWVEDLGYGFGYPIFNFYAPFSYYIGGFTQFVVNDSLLATKVMIGLGILLAGVTMYMLGREFWGDIGGVVSALFYVYAPYHALNVYVRGAVAETWAYGFLPLLFYGFYKVFYTLTSKGEKSERQHKNVKVWIYIAISAAGYAGVILSHNLTAMMVTPFLLCLIGVCGFILYREHTFFASRYLVTAFILGLLISAFYWLPSLIEMKFTNVSSQVGGGADFPDHFVCAAQLWDSPWAFGGSVPGCLDGLSFKIGKLHILGVFFAITLGIIFLRKDRKKIYVLLLALIGCILSLFLMHDISESLWRAIRPMAYFQYPWRFLLLASFFTSFIIGAIPYILTKINHFEKFRKYLPLSAGIVLIFLLISANAKLFTPQRYLDSTAENYIRAEQIKFTASKISDEYMPKGFTKPKAVHEIPQGKMTIPENSKIVYEVNKTQEVVMKTTLSSGANLIANIAYFPAWQVYVDGKKVNIKVFDSRLAVSVPAGEHRVRFVFVQTPVEKLANLLSISGIVLLVAGIIIASRKTYA